MDNVSYVALSAQVSLRHSLDIIANNVANMNTAGFKADRAVFAERVAKMAGENEAKGVSFVIDKHSWTDFSAGTVRQTGSDLNVAIAGDGFLAVETPAGIAYTRDGRFGISADGALVNLEGNPVLDVDGAPIQLPPNVGRISIGRDGIISADGAQVARLGVFMPAEPQNMQKLGNSSFLSDGGLEPVEQPRVMQGMLEDSNVSGIAEMTRLIGVTRAYGNADRLSSNADELKKDAISRIGRA